MDWSNERYVRLYTRDTADWLAMSWEAHALFCLLQRKCDRSGLIETRHGVAGLAGLVRMPREVVARALPELLQDGWIEVCEGGFLDPNFIESQEAKMSNAQRARESRAARRDRARRPLVTKRDEQKEREAAPVTERDDGESTEPSLVTKRDKNVPPSLAVPNQPSQPSQPVLAADAVDPRIRLVVAANRAIAERMGGEQPVGIRAGSGHSFEAANEILTTHGIPLAFAELAIADIAATARWDKPPRTLRYFVDAIVERWGESQALATYRNGSDAPHELRARAEWLRGQVHRTGIHRWAAADFEQQLEQHVALGNITEGARLRDEWALYGAPIKTFLAKDQKDGSFLPFLIRLMAETPPPPLAVEDSAA